MHLLLIIAIGGALGSVMRFLLSKLIQGLSSLNFPFGIFAVNVLGSFLIGFLATFFIEKYNVSDIWRTFILIGFLGGFTTFSSFSIDAVNLLRLGFPLHGFIYIVSSVVFCLLATWFGILLAK